MIEFKRTVKFEADRVPGFDREITSVPGCEQLDSCIQCGTCSGVCPLSVYMDYTPRQVMELTRSSFKHEVLSCFTIWLCASCYSCTVECPREIRITDIMYELKQRAIKDHVYPKKFPIPVLAQEFTKMVMRNGRITELLLVMNLFRKTSLMDAMGNWRMGFDLLKTHRLSPAVEKIKQHGELKRMFDAVDMKNGTKP